MDVKGRAVQRLKDLVATEHRLAFERLQLSQRIDEIDVTLKQLRSGRLATEQVITDLTTAETIVEAKTQERSAKRAAKKKINKKEA